MKVSYTDRRGWFRDFVEIVAVLFAICLFTRTFLLAPYRISTDRLSPSLLLGDLVMVSKASYGIYIPVLDWHFGDSSPREKDLVVVDLPHEQGLVARRVWAVAGDRVQLVKTSLIVNGSVKLKNLLLPEQAEMREWVVPPEQVFIGSQSKPDSKFDGELVPTKSLVGKIIFIFFSLNWLEHPKESFELPGIRWQRCFLIPT